MANRITIGLEISSTDLRDTDSYGTGALLRLSSATTQTGSYAEIATEAILAGVESYEIWDAVGTASTWYKHRVSNAGDTRTSGYSEPFQVDSNQYATLDVVKDRLGLTASTDDARLGRMLVSVSRFMTNRVGLFVGPSKDTVRTFDGWDARGRILDIPGGIRTWTLVEVASGTGEVFETVTLADVVARPKAYELGPGEPYSWLEFLDVVSGDWSCWPNGMDNCRITGTFGWAEVPEDLAELAARLTVRAWLSRSSGQADVVGSDQMGNAIVSRFMSRIDYLTLDSYRNRGLILI